PQWSVWPKLLRRIRPGPGSTGARAEARARAGTASVPARQLERVRGLLHMVDCHGDCIAAHALTVVCASALFDPVVQVLEPLKPRPSSSSRNTLARRRGVGFPVGSSIRRPAPSTT